MGKDHWKNAHGHEVDFVVAFPDRRPPTLVQVCESLDNPQTAKRELRALEAGMAATGAATSVLVTLRDEESDIATTSGNIHIVPLWRFLLSAESPLP